TFSTQSNWEATMRGLLSAIYSTCAYLFFFGTFVYAIGFVEGVLAPKDIDDGHIMPLGAALAMNSVLLAIFAVQHSVMARPAFKRMWTKIVPKSIERSTYVVAASSALALLMWQWRPAPQLVWSVQDEIAAGVIYGLSWCGFALVLASTFLISHFHLFGLSQGFARLLNIPESTQSHFVTPLFYKWVRHPLYLGFIIAFWAAPDMSAGRLFFAIATTGYIFIGIFLEERDLVGEFGHRYYSYRKNVGMLVPKLHAARKAKRKLV
ncbi:MAG: methanethiol S-methyltransferase, partial [Caulobacterales bacterium]